MDHNILQLLKLLIKFITELIDLVLAFLAILPDLPMMDLIPQLLLPHCNMGLQHAHLLHQGFELDVGLDLQTVVGDQFQAFLDEGEDHYLFIGAKAAIFVLVEHPHELLHRAHFGQRGQILLELLEDHLDHILGHVRARNIVLGNGSPYFDAFGRTPDVGIGFSLYFVYYRWVDRVQGVQGFGVELDCR